jgi:nicotinamidase-related amidase
MNMETTMEEIRVKRIDKDHTALVMVDFQQRLMPSIDAAGVVIEEAVFLARVAKALSIRVVGTEQNPAGLGPNIPAIRTLCDPTLPKLHFDACREGLVDLLRAGNRDISNVVIVGCEAHVCLLQTALGLTQAGLGVFVAAAACGARTPEDHRLAMQRLAQAGAVIVSPAMVAFEWLDSCDNPAFGSVLALIKEHIARRPGSDARDTPGGR